MSVMGRGERIETTAGEARLVLVQGDITAEKAEAVVNAANSGLRGGGGVDGAIHRAGGPEIMEQCRAIGGCPTGEAVVTGAGRLRSLWVIHAVAPVWRGGGQGEAELLASAYRRSLALAEERGVRTIALPSLGTGAYGYPLEEAARIALGVAFEHLQSGSALEELRFVLFDARSMAAFHEALEELVPPAEPPASSDIDGSPA
jgi:O-acetyl-ADP-ribose deacetylase (regulator of RNase III)